MMMYQNKIFKDKPHDMDNETSKNTLARNHHTLDFGSLFQAGEVVIKPEYIAPLFLTHTQDVVK